MATNFPSSLDTLTNPSAGDPQNNPSHSAQHANANDAIEALEAKVGINSSAVTTSHDYKLSEVTGKLSEVTGTDKAVGKTAIQTLSNKTLTIPKIDTIAEETAGNGVVVDGIKLKDGNSIQNTGTADHISITPGTSKLVKLAVLRQDNTTNNYKNNSVVLTGWGFILGNDSSGRLSETVTFGITFSEEPIVVSSLNGTRVVADGTPTSPAWFTTPGNVSNNVFSSNAYATTTSSFILEMARQTGVYGSATNYGYNWIAIGQLN